jgi:ABC-type bacteriocin/lantibiotic exporter with double-glycine peptidase domain
MNNMIAGIASSSEHFKSRRAFVKPAFSKQKNIFRRTFEVLTPQERTRFYFLASLDIIINLVDIFSLALLLWIIQFYIQPTQSKTLSILPAWMMNKGSIAFLAIFFFLFVIKNLLAFFIVSAQNNFTAAIAVRISKHNLISYQRADFEEFVNTDSSVHIRKIALQPFEFCQYLLSGLQQIITQTSLIVITIAAILFLSAKLFLLLLLILLPPVISVFFFIKKRLTKDKLQIKTSNQLSFQYLMDALKGYVEANIYERNNFFLQRFIDYRKKYSSHLFSSITIQTLPGRLVEIFAVLGLFVLVVVANWSGGNNSGALITIGAFMAAAYKIIPGIVRIVNIASQVKAHEFSLGEITNLGDETLVNQSKLIDRIQSVQFANVSFQYKGSEVINNLSFSAEQGDFIGITGKSGRGKTTILNMLLGFLFPSGGKIIINDEVQWRESVKKFWPSISYVRQQSFFIHDTILQNITLEDAYCEERLQYAIEASGLSNFIKESPEGMNKIIAENGKNISGGQQQRISLARALYKDSDVILLDEPFNELDETSEIALLNLLAQLANSGKIVVLVTHNKNALSFCNKTISLDEE